MAKTLKQIKNDYYNLLIYSLKNDYKKWYREDNGRENEDSYISPKYGSLEVYFEYTFFKGVEVKAWTLNNPIIFKSYFNCFSLRKRCIKKMINYVDNREFCEKQDKIIAEHQKIINATEKTLNQDPNYKQYKRGCKLKRITEE